MFARRPYARRALPSVRPSARALKSRALPVPPASAMAESSDAAGGRRPHDVHVPAVLRLALAGVFITAALFTTTIVALACLERRLGAQETKLTEMLSLYSSQGAAEAELLKDVSDEAEQPHKNLRPVRRGGRSLNSEADHLGLSLSAAISRATAAGRYWTHLSAIFRQGRHQLHATERRDLGYMEWTFGEADSSLPQAPDRLLLTAQRWIQIKESGTYYVYSQVTWWGKHAADSFASQEKYRLENHIVMSPNVTIHRRSRTQTTLATGTVTPVQSHCTADDKLDCPMDSSYTGGVFHLPEGSSVAVMATTTAAICTHPEKTYLGLYMLRMD